MQRRVSWRSAAAVLLILGSGAAIALYYYAEMLVERRLKPATVRLLEERFDSTVELESLSVAFTPALSVRAEGLTLRHRGRTDVPPLITMRALTISGALTELWARRVDRVHVEGLALVIPPRRSEDARSPADGFDGESDIFIRELVADESLLSILSKRADKGPRVFQIRRLRFESFHFAEAIPFEAAITNPTPHGEIVAMGAFGPWVSSEPSLTPVEGTFLFDADLGTIKGIGGELHAEGDFTGPLDYIRTTGRTRTKGFHLSTGGATFPLSVDYVAIVDGTNGDTTLERVDGMLGTTRISASGAIVKVEGVSGRRVTLDTRTRGGRLEDLIKLTTRVASAPMSGTVNAAARLDIPPGGAEVIERMDLDGSFSVAHARFTTATIQARVDELSRRGSGRPGDISIEEVASDMRGAFRLRDGRLRLRSLRFSVAGATVQLAGDYDIKRERLDFSGELRLQAKVSQTQSGWKRFVLKLFDPMLDGPGAGTVLPISITGTREQPKFAADIRRAIFQ